VHAAEGVLFVVLNPELADDLAVEVAQQREVQAELLGEGLVGAVALDADPEYGPAKLADAVGFVPKLGQFDRSNTAEVEHVPGQDHGAFRELLAQGDLLTRAGGQGEVGRPVADVELRHGVTSRRGRAASLILR
jgi:hypothetical protein